MSVKPFRQLLEQIQAAPGPDLHRVFLRVLIIVSISALAAVEPSTVKEKSVAAVKHHAKPSSLIWTTVFNGVSLSGSTVDYASNMTQLEPNVTDTLSATEQDHLRLTTATIATEPIKIDIDAIAELPAEASAQYGLETGNNTMALNSGSYLLRTTAEDRSRSNASRHWHEHEENASLQTHNNYTKRQKRAGDNTMSCRDGWTRRGNNCYRLTSALSWNEAQQACLSMGGTLTDISNENEQNDVYDVIREQRPNLWSAWIGLSDQEVKGQWKYASGRIPTYYNWARWEPNNPDTEHCVETYASMRWGWNNQNCAGNKVPGVCKALCETGWAFRRQSCYKLTAPMTWFQAQQACHSMNGFLTDIGDSNKQNDVYDVIRELQSGLWSAWIGLNDQQAENRFVWESGYPVSYLSWMQGEPNNAGAGEDCVQVVAANAGWMDFNCNNERAPGLCERRAHTCGGSIRGSGVIVSPEYPQQYPQGADCRWNVETVKADNAISLRFWAFDLGDSGDEMVIRDGSEFQYTFTAQQLPYNLLLRSPIEIALISLKTPWGSKRFNITVEEVSGNAPRICRSGPWVMYGEMCLAALWYLPLSSQQQGKEECAMMGGFLVSIENNDQLQTVGEFLDYHAPSTGEVWIGLKYNSYGGNFSWDRGSKLEYSSWDAEEPKEPLSDATCVALTMQGVSGAWFTDNCSTPRVPMCSLVRYKIY